MANIKSTINIKEEFKKQLEYWVEINRISSITEGVNIALDDYIKRERKSIYAEEMKKASMDPDFIKRTLDCQNDFKYVDEEMDNNMLLEDSEW